MDLLDKIDDVLEQKDYEVPKKFQDKKVEFKDDGELFNRMARFIFDLDPDILSDEQIKKVEDIIDTIEIMDKGEEKIEELKSAHKSTAGKNSYAKKWYRMNKHKVKRRREQFRRSSEGKKREKNKDKNAERGRNKSGGAKLNYHRRIKSHRFEEYKNRERHGK
jgi:hypothetical protein